MPNVPAASSLQSGLRKAGWRLIPLLSACYLVAYMDRANISFAAETMNRDLHFSPKVYGLGAGLFFLTYALCEIPSNTLMLRFGARRWLARIMLTWGVIAGGMVLVRTPAHLYSARLLLGCAEAGYFPGALFYLSRWFPGTVRARAISFFYVSLPVSSVLMGSVAGALLRLNGRLGLAGWQWMFLVEAAPAVLLSFALWFGLPDDIAGARWLTAAERAAMTAAIGTNASAQHTTAVAKAGLREVLRHGRVWALGIAYFCELGISYALTFSLPLLVKRLTGWDAEHAGFLLAALGLFGAGAMILFAWLSDRSGRRSPIIVTGFALMAIGAIAAGVHLSGWGAVAALGLVMLSYYAMQGPMLSAMTTVLPGESAALAIAFANTLAICGGFAGPYWMGWMRETTGNYSAGIGLLAVPAVVAGGAMLWVLRPPANGGVEWESRQAETPAVEPL